MQLPNFLVSSSRFIPLFVVITMVYTSLYINWTFKVKINPKNLPKWFFFFKEKKAMHFLSQLKFLLLQFSSSFNWLRLYIIFIE